MAHSMHSHDTFHTSSSSRIVLRSTYEVQQRRVEVVDFPSITGDSQNSSYRKMIVDYYFVLLALVKT
jgi:hypothetical protein